MPGVFRAGVFALVASFVLVLTACGGTAASPVASPASPAPLTQLSELAYRYRSSAGPTQAWWLKLPLSEASRLVGEDLGGAGGAQDPEVYLVILNGDFTGGDGQTHFEWEVLIPRADAIHSGTTGVVMKDRPDAPGHAWTSLALASP